MVGGMATKKYTVPLPEETARPVGDAETEALPGGLEAGPSDPAVAGALVVGAVRPWTTGGPVPREHGRGSRAFAGARTGPGTAGWPAPPRRGGAGGAVQQAPRSRQTPATPGSSPRVHQAARQAWPRWVADWPPL